MERIDDLTFGAMFAVLQGGMWLLNDLEAYLRPLGMSQARLSILLAVEEAGGGDVSPGKLARVTGKSRPAITRTAEKLTEEGYLLAERNGWDGRGKNLILTGKGRDLLNDIVPGYNRRILAMSRDLDEADKKGLIRLLGRIRFPEAGIIPGEV